jgi:hypothetical protein
MRSGITSERETSMFTAAETFHQSIQDAQNLLKHFDTLNKQPPAPENEVLKRAGLIMALTAWETYVEDRLQEITTHRLANLNDPVIAEFVRCRLDEDIKRLHNPNSNKTLELFRSYAGIDVSRSWSWENKDPTAAREQLDQYLSLRGDVVHRSRKVNPAGPPQPHPVKKEELKRAVQFLKSLVKATEDALSLWSQGAKPA